MKKGNETVDDERYVNLNISGRHYHCIRKDFLPYLDTRLGRLASSSHIDAEKLCDLYIESTQEFYFNRPPDLFDLILNFYRNEEIHVPFYCCAERFIDELIYWGIDTTFIAHCCQKSIPNRFISFSRKSTLVNKFSSGTNSTVHLTGEQYQFKCCRPLRIFLWDLLADSSNTIQAKIISLVSFSFVFASTILLVLDSLPEFQSFNPETNETDATRPLFYADAVCVSWFTLEYLLRSFAAPKTILFLRQPISIIDFVAVIPFYLEIILSSAANFKVFKSLHLLRLLRILRILRIIRVLKVARYSKGMRVVGHALYKSWHELLFLVVFTFTACLMFSTLMFYLERDAQGSRIRTIPEAAWWCIITMSTVGYGDVYPISIAGKLLAGFVSVSGIIILAFPLSIIVRNFHHDYRKTDQKEIVLQRVFWE